MTSPEDQHGTEEEEAKEHRQTNKPFAGLSNLPSVDLQRLTVLLLAGLVVRLLYVALVRHDPLFFSAFLDADAYRSWARLILREGSLWPEVPDHMPFYSYLQSVLLLLFDDPWNPLFVLQIVVGLFTACLVFLLGRNLFGRVPGYLGMVLFLFHPDWIVLETRPVPTVWVGAAVALGMLALMYTVESDHPRWGWLVCSSLSFVCAAGMVGSVLFVVPVLLFWFFFCRGWSVSQRFSAAVVWGVPVVLFVCGVLFLNHRTMVESYGSGGLLLHASSGRMLYAGSGPGATGYPPSRPGLRHDRMQRKASREAGDHPYKKHMFYTGETRTYVFNHPVQFLKTAGKKAYYLVSNSSIEPTEPVAALKHTSMLFRVNPIPFGFFVVLGMIGLVRTFWRGGAPTGVSLAILALLIVPMLTGASVRNRLVGLPLLSVLSGHGLLFAAVAIQDVNLRQLAWVVPLSAICMIGFAPLLKANQLEETVYLVPYWRAKAQWTHGRSMDAIETLQEGRTNPVINRENRVFLDYLFAKYTVEVRSNNGKEVEGTTEHPMYALQHLLRRINERNLHFPEAYALMGRVRRGNDQNEEAIEHFRTALRQEPDRDTWKRLGETLLEEDRYREATEEMSKALETFPDCEECRLVRARALGFQKKWQKALDELQTVIEREKHKPTSDHVAWAHFYAGYVNERTGKADRAFQHYERAMEFDDEVAKKAKKRIDQLREQIEKGVYGQGGLDD